MDSTRFQTEPDVDNFIRKYVDGIPGIDLVNKDLLSTKVKQEMEEMEIPNFGRGALGFIIPKYYYVIKNDDLPIFESLFDGLKAAAGADFFISLSTADVNKAWAAAIGVFGILYKLYKNIKNKGKVMPALEFQVLLYLKCHPEGVEIAYLKFLLEKDGIPLTEDKLKLLLDGLNEVYMNDGTKKQLVIVENNLYYARGI